MINYQLLKVSLGSSKVFSTRFDNISRIIFSCSERGERIYFQNLLFFACNGIFKSFADVDVALIKSAFARELRIIDGPNSNKIFVSE